MKGSTKLILILVLMFGVLFSLALLTTGNHAIDTIANHAEQQQTALDIVLQSRQTAPAPAPSNNPVWLPVGIFALFLVVSGIAILALFRGEKFIKAWRLLKKKQQQSIGRVSYSPYADYPQDVPMIRNVRNVPMLRDGQNEQVNHYDY